MKKNNSSYSRAGVDIDEMMSSLSAIKRMVKGTATSDCLGGIGSFGGVFRSPGTDTALVASTDGVGTKLKVAAMARRHTSVGQDLVNHCVNDILVQGARPLFFLDYLGTSKLHAKTFRDVIWGLCKACRENHCALLGGETAEMPALYPEKEYDLVGTIIGVVPRSGIVTGSGVRPGDAVIGLSSTGLHTNGYSLARQIVFETASLRIHDRFPGMKKTVAEMLLAVHKSYLRAITALMKAVTIQGMAHITGGGLIDNLPRSLPDNTLAVIDTKSWRVPRIFTYLQETGHVEAQEMYRVFNMGIGYVVIVRQRDAERTLRILRGNGSPSRRIGCIEKGEKRVVLQM